MTNGILDINDFNDVAQSIDPQQLLIAASGPWQSRLVMDGSLPLGASVRGIETASSLHDAMKRFGIQHLVDPSDEAEGMHTAYVSNPDSIQRVHDINRMIIKQTLTHLSKPDEPTIIDLDHTSTLANTALVRALESEGIKHDLTSQQPLRDGNGIALTAGRDTLEIEANALEKLAPTVENTSPALKAPGTP